MTNKTLDRGAGLILPVFSLPSPYGCGTMGKAAYEFIDFLKDCGQKYWQVLPLGPTSYGDSPYQAYSAFAGNPYFVDLDMLCDEGLLDRWYVQQIQWTDNESYVDYGKLYNNRFRVLREAFGRSRHQETEAYKEFCKENEYWLEDYCLFMTVKNAHGGKCWLDWDEDIKLRKPEAIEKYKTEYRSDMEFWAFVQFKFYEQWAKVKAYAEEKKIQIIGDVPIYCAPDNCDVWTHPSFFLLEEENLLPKCIAGVPPDAFSADGQLWGNPLYDWEAQEKDGFSWWTERVKASAKLYHVLRIDHFIGITRYFAVPYGATSAREGKYYPGPGQKLTDAINAAAGDMKIIAEDLGIVTPEVKKLLADNNYPGMKVLAFGFDGDPKNEHLPQNFKTSNMVVYGGTHDNETLTGQFAWKSDEELGFLFNLLWTRDRNRIVEGMFRLAYGSQANVAMFQAQDVLKLDNSARINFPGSMGTNWRWRLRPGQLNWQEKGWLEFLTRLYNR